MRCISPLSRYSIQVFEGEEQIIVDARGYAKTHTLRKPVIADFEVSGLLDHEELAAIESFSFSGLPEGVSPLSKISVFDTDAYCQQFPEKAIGDRPGRDEIQAQIDKRLRELAEIFPTQFIVVDQPDAAKPWPSYDEMDVEEILKFQQVLGLDPQLIRLYELENAGRDAVVFAMLVQEDPQGAATQYPELVDSLTASDEGAEAGFVVEA